MAKANGDSQACADSVGRIIDISIKAHKAVTGLGMTQGAAAERPIIIVRCHSICLGELHPCWMCTGCV